MFELIKDIDIGMAVHASTLASHDGQLFVAFFGGSREGNPDTAIYIMRKDDKWHPAKVLAKVGDIAHWNPILFPTKDRLICYFKIGIFCDSWRTLITSSKDGKKWGEPEQFGEDELRGPSRNKPVVLSSGTILAPGSDEEEYWRCYIERSTDGGETWTKSEEIADQVRLIQPAIWEVGNGIISCLIRSDAGRLYRSDSSDDGRTWSKPAATNIPNNNSGIDVAKHKGKVYLALNPIARNGIRSPLSLAVADDGGYKFRLVDNIERGNGIPEVYEEYSYPCLLDTGDELLVSYTVNRKIIRIKRIRCDRP